MQSSVEALSSTIVPITEELSSQTQDKHSRKLDTVLRKFEKLKTCTRQHQNEVQALAIDISNFESLTGEISEILHSAQNTVDDMVLMDSPESLNLAHTGLQVILINYNYSELYWSIKRSSVKHHLRHVAG